MSSDTTYTCDRCGRSGKRQEDFSAIYVSPTLHFCHSEHGADTCYKHALAALKGLPPPEPKPDRCVDLENALAEVVRLGTELKEVREALRNAEAFGASRERELADAHDAHEMNREVYQERCAMVAEVLAMLGKKARAKHANRIAEIERILVLESRPVDDPVKEAVRRARVERAQIESPAGSSFLERCHAAAVKHDEEEKREKCGRESETPGYLPCRRPPHDDGPCAHEPRGAR